MVGTSADLCSARLGSAAFRTWGVLHCDPAGAADITQTLQAKPNRQLLPTPDWYLLCAFSTRLHSVTGSQCSGVQGSRAWAAGAGAGSTRKDG